MNTLALGGQRTKTSVSLNRANMAADVQEFERQRETKCRREVRKQTNAAKEHLPRLWQKRNESVEEHRKREKDNISE